MRLQNGADFIKRLELQGRFPFSSEQKSSFSLSHAPARTTVPTSTSSHPALRTSPKSSELLPVRLQ
jgi:hypothetical protein